MYEEVVVLYFELVVVVMVSFISFKDIFFMEFVCLNEGFEES